MKPAKCGALRLWIVAALAAIQLPFGYAAFAESVQPKPWAELARGDLEGMRALFEANYAGAADPDNAAARNWLDDGFKQSLEEAAKAENFADYRRALRRYANGFRDIHVTVATISTIGAGAWPGFIVVADDDGVPKVGWSEVDGLPLGARLASCDGKSFETLSSERIDPYFYNNDIPHWRRDFYNRMFYIPDVDTQRLHRCEFQVGSAVIAKALNWGTIEDGRFATLFDKAAASEPLPPTGFREKNGIWNIAIRDFGGSSESDERLRTLVADIERNRDALRSAKKVVIDLRDNPGGNSDWGNKVGVALWGLPLMQSVLSSPAMRETTIVRASPANRAVYVRYSMNPDLGEEGRGYYRAIIAAMDEALKSGQAMSALKTEEDGEQAPARAENPVKGHVYVLTRGCGSACLDFLDFALVTPGVTQIGLPTLADAVYTETGGLVPLPSGLAGASYSMKKLIRRRKHNQWYEPAIRWPGGPMTAKAVEQWIDTLP
jgi:hypothetical protein